MTLFNSNSGQDTTYGGILLKALELINKDRRVEYGPAEKSFNDIADLWSIYLDVDISSKDVAIMMTLFKIAREKAAHKEDNLVDAVGYLALANDVREK